MLHTRTSKNFLQLKFQVISVWGCEQWTPWTCSPVLAFKTLAFLLLSLPLSPQPPLYSPIFNKSPNNEIQLTSVTAQHEICARESLQNFHLPLMLHPTLHRHPTFLISSPHFPRLAALFSLIYLRPSNSSFRHFHYRSGPLDLWTSGPLDLWTSITTMWSPPWIQT